MLTLPDLSAQSPDYTYKVTIDRVIYTIRMVWNLRMGAWYLTISNDLGESIAGVRVVANMPLLETHRGRIGLRGDILALDNSIVPTDPTYSSFSNGHTLVFMTNAEVAGWKADQPKYFVGPALTPEPPPPAGVIIDGRLYPIVTIGSQVWMAENLKALGVGLSYNNNSGNDETYGRYYNPTEAAALTPLGWHLPNNTEWATLLATTGAGVDSSPIRSTTTWSSPGTNTTGFNATASGLLYNGDSYQINSNFYFRSSTFGSYWSMIWDNGTKTTVLADNAGSNVYASVRYIKD